MSQSILPVFSSKSFIVSGVTFRSLIHFEFSFVYGVREYLKPFISFFFKFNFIFYTAGSYQLSILYILVYTCQSQSPNASHHHHPPATFPPWCPYVCSALYLFNVYGMYTAVFFYIPDTDNFCTCYFIFISLIRDLIILLNFSNDPYLVLLCLLYVCLLFH